MGVNLDKPKKWKADVAKSVDMYNDWFMKFAPQDHGGGFSLDASAAHKLRAGQRPMKQEELFAEQAA